MNMYWFMQTLLDRKDRMSMYNGLEVRVPFCDHRIAEYMYSVPWEMKEYQGMEKGLLRYAVKGILPEEIRTRKKSPYPKTHNPQYTSIAVSYTHLDVYKRQVQLHSISIFIKVILLGILCAVLSVIFCKVKMCIRDRYSSAPAVSMW